ncbi:MAG TPA: hypothetical protein VM165_15450 [Planctomycetaceae bacterium]|nr:hypothetical protein [Planctomycetaceae bacterium]
MFHKSAVRVLSIAALSFTCAVAFASDWGIYTPSDDGLIDRSSGSCSCGGIADSGAEMKVQLYASNGTTLEDQAIGTASTQDEPYAWGVVWSSSSSWTLDTMSSRHYCRLKRASNDELMHPTLPQVVQ